MLVAMAVAMPPSSAKAYPGPDERCPYGWDVENQVCLQLQPGGPGGGRLDAECQATADFRACQGSVAVGCRSNGFVTACRLLQLSQSDPNLFQQIMSAQKACTLDRNRDACAYLQQFRGVYF